MPCKINTFQLKEAVITLWDTGNLSITTKETLDSAELDALLAEMSINVPCRLHSAIESMNMQLPRQENLTFLIAQDHSDSDYVEYISSNALYRLYKNEMRLEMLLPPVASPEKILLDLQTLNIISGIQFDVLRKNIKNPAPDYFVAALGIHPVLAKPRQYEFNFLTRRPVPVCIKQRGKVMFLDFTLENRVLQNDRIASFQEAVLGQNGKTLSGFLLPTDPVSATNVPILGKNVVEREGNVYAGREGMVNFDSDLICVIPTKVFSREVKGKTISFDGTVIVLSQVSNSTIKATHDVILHGRVQDSKIEASGFAYLLTGISGKHSELRATYDVFCPFVHQANMTSTQGNILVAYEAFNAKLVAKGTIRVEKAFWGGELCSSTCIKLQAAGNEKTNAPTILRLTLQLEEKDQLHQLQQETQRVIQVYRQLLQRKQRHETEFLKNKPENTLSRAIKREERKVRTQLEALKNKENSLRAFLADETRNMILVYGNLYRGTTIIINEFEHPIKKDLSAFSFTLGKYGILQKRYS
ncbi:MAG: FapA family protein [Candidatus Margulisiibacteriota bacterium]